VRYIGEVGENSPWNFPFVVNVMKRFKEWKESCFSNVSFRVMVLFFLFMTFLVSD
jgi:hypothetical protein